MSIAKMLCLCLLFLLSHHTKASSVTLMVEDYPPYIQRYSEQPGFLTELVSKSFARVDVNTEVKFASWYRVENAIDDDKVLSFMWQANKKRVRKWHFSDAIYLQRFSFVSRADFKTDIEHLHSLRGLKVGLVDGIKYGKKLDSFRNKLNVQLYDSDFALLGALLQGGVDIIAMDVAATRFLLKSHYEKKGQSGVKFVASKHFQAMPYYLVCSKNYGNCLDHIKLFNKGLSMMESDGSKKALIDNAEKL